jgi:hypothetical protein
LLILYLAEVSKALEKVVLEKGLQLHATWLNKCIQLYETYLVRHGGSGCCWKVVYQGCLV